jgi:hypothetical protein
VGQHGTKAATRSLRERSMKRTCLAGLLALCLVLEGYTDARAGEQWCETDPVVLVTTPGGSVVSVYVTNGAGGLQYLPLLQLAEIRYTVSSVEGGSATLVKMTVTVPTGGGSRFQTTTAASTGPLKTGAILDEASGVSGKPMRLEFKLGTP